MWYTQYEMPPSPLRAENTDGNSRAKWEWPAWSQIKSMWQSFHSIKSSLRSCHTLCQWPISSQIWFVILNSQFVRNPSTIKIILRPTVFMDQSTPVLFLQREILRDIAASLRFICDPASIRACQCKQSLPGALDQTRICYFEDIMWVNVVSKAESGTMGTWVLTRRRHYSCSNFTLWYRQTLLNGVMCWNITIKSQVLSYMDNWNSPAIIQALPQKSYPSWLKYPVKSITYP